MTRWCKGLAAVAAWLGLAAATWAQTETYSHVGAARMPEPVRYPVDPPPNLAPGPLNPYTAPLGPPPWMDLPARHNNAFPLERFPTEESFWAHVGIQGLRRWRVEHSPVVYSDPGVPSDLFPRTPVSMQLVGDPNSLQTDYAVGPRVAFGYLFGNHGIEFAGFWSPQNTFTKTITDPGRLTLDFGIGDGQTLPGFGGGAAGNSIWEKADLVQFRFQTALAGAEANYRMWNGGFNDLELILGVRGIFLQDKLSIYTDDNFATQDGFGRSDQTLAATYTSLIRTYFAGIQGGAEYSYEVPLTRGVVWLHGMGKAAFGANYIERSLALRRGDGLVGVDRRDSKVQFGGVYELQGGLDLHLMDRVRARFAYQALWITGTTNPSAQVNFDLANQSVGGFGSTSILFHGPVFEMQFLF